MADMKELERLARVEAERLAGAAGKQDGDEAARAGSVLAGLGIVALCSIAASLERLTAVFAPVDGDA
jgi:hypothetical protein